LYAGTDFGVFRSTDVGETWSAVNSGLTSLSVFVLTIDPLDSSTLYAGTTGGVFVIRFDP
jgi:ligand-binding sensor domain-containing protein